MALNANKIQGNKRPAQANLEPDVYPARLVQIIDFGLQAQKPWQGKEKAPVNVIGFTYELAEEFMKDEDGNDLKDKPRWISEDMPFYGLKADKAKSTERYNAFDPNGVFEGDFAQCIGSAVNITVVNNKVGDIVYDNIGGVAPMSAKKAEKLPPLVNKPKVFDLDAPDMDIFNAFPKWIQDKIKANLNFNGSILQKKLGGKQTEVGLDDPPAIATIGDGDNSPY